MKLLVRCLWYRFQYDQDYIDTPYCCYCMRQRAVWLISLKHACLSVIFAVEYSNRRMGGVETFKLCSQIGQCVYDWKIWWSFGLNWWGLWLYFYICPSFSVQNSFQSSWMIEKHRTLLQFVWYMQQRNVVLHVVWLVPSLQYSPHIAVKRSRNIFPLKGVSPIPCGGSVI